MDQAAVREVMHQTSTAGEPPLGSLIRDSLQTGLRMRRRRRLQIAGAGAAAIAVLAGGIPAAVGAARTSAASGSTARSTATAQGTSPAARAPQPPQGFRLVRPVVPAQVRRGPYLDTTGQSAGQLILDLLPHGSSVVPGSTFYAQGTDNSTCRRGLACLPSGQLTVRAGGVSSLLFLQVSGKHEPLTTCADDGENSILDNISCRLYQLPGRVAVQEYLADIKGSHGFTAEGPWFGVAVQRAGYSQVSVTQEPVRVAGSRPGFALTEDQLVRLAADPRWGVRMPASFVLAARPLHLPGVKLVYWSDLHEERLQALDGS